MLRPVTHPAFIGLFATLTVATCMAEEIVVKDCVIAPFEQASIPAEEAGVIESVLIRRGQLVEPRTPLAQLKDTEARIQVSGAQFRLDAAEKDARSTAEIRVAEKTFGLASKELENSIRINAKSNVGQPVSQTEIDRQRLTKDRAEAQIDVAKLDRQSKIAQSDIRRTELELAKAALKRRRIAAPIAGVIVRQLKFVGEWVQPGDTVFEIIRLNRLSVKGWIPARRIAPERLLGKSVTISLGNESSTRRVRGRITYASPVISSTGDFQIEAEFENVREGSSWAYRPGQGASMVVDVD